MEDLMSKFAKKRPARSIAKSVSAGKASSQAGKSKKEKRTATAAALPAPVAKKPDAATDPKAKPARRDSKQSRVLAMLQSPAGATITAMTQATGWQQHSVRGFLAGVVRKRLKLDLTSKKVDGSRVYQVASGAGGKSVA
jgi:hypothetical protein